MKNIKVLVILIVIIAAVFAGCSNMLTEDPNRPPSLVMDETVYTLYPGVVQQLDISDSTDIDTQELTYSWTVYLEPDNAIFTLDGSDSSIASFSAETEGEYRILAVIEDEYDMADTTTVTITVDNLDPTADAGAGASRYPGVEYSLNGSATDDDPDGTGSLTYSWEVVSQPAADSEYTLTDADTLTPAFVTAYYTDGDANAFTEPDYIGDYTLRLTVTDEWGATATSDAVVSIGTVNPTATLAVPALTGGVSVNLSGTGSEDSDSLSRQTSGDLHYVWSVTDSPVGSQWNWAGGDDGTVASYNTSFTDNVDWQQDSAGVYTLRLTVYDEYGASSSSTVVSAAAVNTAPVVLDAQPVTDLVSTSDTIVGAGTDVSPFSDDDTGAANDSNDTFSIDPTASSDFTNTENDTIVYSWRFDDFADSLNLIVDGTSRTLEPGQVVTTDHLSSTLTIAPVDADAYPDGTWDFTIILTADDGLETDVTDKIYFDLF